MHSVAFIYIINVCDLCEKKFVNILWWNTWRNHGTVIYRKYNFGLFDEKE